VEQLEFCHRKSMTSFSQQRRAVFPRKSGTSAAAQANSYPLKNAKSQLIMGSIKRGFFYINWISHFYLSCRSDASVGKVFPNP
jgi:hypothetical protein